MKEIELICRRSGYEVNPHRTVFANVLNSDGTITKVPVVVFDKDPRGNWKFIIQKGKNYSSYTFRESKEWAYTGPTEVTDEMKRRSPGIDVRYGDPTKEYVTIEDACMAFLESMKAEVTAGEFALVCTRDVALEVKKLIDFGWPTNRIENMNFIEELDKPISGRSKKVEV